MRFIISIATSLLAFSSFARDAKQGVYVPPQNDPRLKNQVVRMTLGDNEKTAVVKYRYGDITRLVFPTDTNTASCEVNSNIILVDNPKASESLKGKRMFFRRISIKTVNGAGKDFTAEDDQFLKNEYIKVICTYERFNITYERAIMVQLTSKRGSGYSIVFFEHPHDRFFQEYNGLRVNSVREIIYDADGKVIGDRKKGIKKGFGPDAMTGSRYPILIVPVDEAKKPYWGARI